MHGLLMSLRRAGLWRWRGEAKKTQPASPWGFLGKGGGIRQAQQKQCSCSKMQINWSEVPGVTPHSPHCPPLYSVKYRASVKSILGRAIVFQEATVKLEWWRPGQGQGISPSQKSSALFLKSSWLDRWAPRWAAHPTHPACWLSYFCMCPWGRASRSHPRRTHYLQCPSSSHLTSSTFHSVPCLPL